jgi:hypothetical protein
MIAVVVLQFVGFVVHHQHPIQLVAEPLQLKIFSLSAFPLITDHWSLPPCLLPFLCGESREVCKGFLVVGAFLAAGLFQATTEHVRIVFRGGEERVELEWVLAMWTRTE